MCADVLQGLETVRVGINYTNIHTHTQLHRQYSHHFPLNTKQFTVLSLVQIQGTFSYRFLLGVFHSNWLV